MGATRPNSESLGCLDSVLSMMPALLDKISMAREVHEKWRAKHWMLSKPGLLLRVAAAVSVHSRWSLHGPEKAGACPVPTTWARV